MPLNATTCHMNALQCISMNLPGASVVEEEDEADDGEVATLVAELNILIASSGKSVAEVQEMDVGARKAHAKVCALDRGIKAAQVTALPDKLGCPASEATKLARFQHMLEWCACL